MKKKNDNLMSFTENKIGRILTIRICPLIFHRVSLNPGKYYIAEKYLEDFLGKCSYLRDLK